MSGCRGASVARMPGKPWTAAVAVAAVLVLAGCTPEPAPTPSPTGFASEEEAFAAAEATYRAYTVAFDNVDLADPATFEPVLAMTAGQANEDLRESLSQMHADGWQLKGKTQVTSVEVQPLSTQQEARLATCLDVSETTVVDASGNSVVAAERPDVQALSIVLISSEPARWLITSITSRDGGPPCD